MPKCCGLILFVLVLSCTETRKNNTLIIINWEGTRATSISVPLEALDPVKEDSLAKYFRISLPESDQAILGEYMLINDSLRFTPLLPFTKGKQYDLWLRNKKIDEFKIPKPDSLDSPVLLSIYPSGDQLPQNLLKLYFHFSKPMQQGQALEHIHLVRDKTDTLKAAFLDLQPELWNDQGNLLTIWFDPGRIKRDLIPNKTMGPPLVENTSYVLFVDSAWKDTEGLPLTSVISKSFRTFSRDSLSPNPLNWIIYTPVAGSREPLHLEFNEPLDYLLLLNTFQVMDIDGNFVKGSFQPKNEETQLDFIPDKRWEKGNYMMWVESRLEDLAGNNLNRPFDRDITSDSSMSYKKKFELPFKVGP